MASIEERTRDIAESYVRKKKNVLLSVGIIHKEQQHFFAYGDHPLQRDVDPMEIVYEIGSISKVFTTSILAVLLQAGNMELGHSISRYWPEIGEGHPTTIEQLATHTSGLPSYSALRGFMQSFASTVERDPFCQYSLKELEKWLRARTSRRRHKCRYSNVGMGLLGSLMARHEKVTFEQLLKRTVTEPLNLSDTFIAITNAQRDRILPGHSVRGEPVPPLRMNEFQGAGAIRSTMADLLRFLIAHMNAKAGSALAMTHAVRAKMSERLGIGLGWVVDKELAMHNGATTGFSSFMGFSGRTGVVVLSNYRNRLVQDSPDRIAFDLLEMLESEGASSL